MIDVSVNRVFVKLDTPIRGQREKAYSVEVSYVDVENKKNGKVMFWFPKSWLTVIDLGDKKYELYLELWQVERELKKTAEYYKLSEDVTFRDFYSVCDEDKNSELTEIKKQSKKA